MGDHPPRDRTKVLRDLKFKLKGLKEKQLSTDTAVLVTKLIIDDGIEFEDIPFVDDPEIFH